MTDDLSKLRELTQGVNDAVTVLQGMLAVSMTPAELEEYQRAQARTREAARKLDTRERPPLGTWRIMKHRRDATKLHVAFLESWIEPEDKDGHNVMVLPGYPGAAPFASCWQIWTEPLVCALTSLALEGMLLEDATPTSLKP